MFCYINFYLLVFKHSYWNMCTPLLSNYVVFSWLVRKNNQSKWFEQIASRYHDHTWKLERIFPPAFFTIMVHLAIHMKSRLQVWFLIVGCIPLKEVYALWTVCSKQSTFWGLYSRSICAKWIRHFFFFFALPKWHWDSIH